MRMRMHIYRWANFFTFFENLSLSHQATFPALKAFWEQRVGPFSARERQAIAAYRRVRQAHPPDSFDAFACPFYSSRSPWTKVDVLLHISRKPPSVCGRVPGVVLHELIHVLFDGQYYVPLLQALCGTEGETVRVLGELTAASLFPHGILAQKFFGRPRVAHALYGRYTTAEHTRPILRLAREYLDGRKYFDREYVQRLSRIIGTRLPR